MVFSLGIRFVLSGNFGYFGKVIFLTIFSGMLSKKGVFEFLNQFTHFNH
jgi:hypothetical protein